LTLYSGAEALRTSVSEQTPELDRQMKRLEGLREWDLKVSYDAHALAEHLGEVSEQVARLEQEIEHSSPGRRYLLERKRASLVTEETVRVARQLAGDVHEKLASSTHAARRLPLPREKGDLPVVLNAAYLVAREREEEVRGAAAAEGARLGPLGLELRLTGPWAPYRFLAEADDGSEVDG
jgi:hypothetical protein